jgi:hypothetical protein
MAEIVWISKKQLRAMCGKSRSTIDRHLHGIKKLNPPGFDYEERQRGISRNAAQIVMIFNQLVEQRGYSKALQDLNDESIRLGVNHEHRETKSSC